MFPSAPSVCVLLNANNCYRFSVFVKNPAFHHLHQCCCVPLGINITCDYPYLFWFSILIHSLFSFCFFCVFTTTCLYSFQPGGVFCKLAISLLAFFLLPFFLFIFFSVYHTTMDQRPRIQQCTDLRGRWFQYNKFVFCVFSLYLFFCLYLVVAIISLSNFLQRKFMLGLCFLFFVWFCLISPRNDSLFCS